MAYVICGISPDGRKNMFDLNQNGELGDEYDRTVEYLNDIDELFNVSKAFSRMYIAHMEKLHNLKSGNVPLMDESSMVDDLMSD